MGWERRGNKNYYYRTKRVDGKFVRTYLGAGDKAHEAALSHALDRVEHYRKVAETEAVVQATKALIDYSYAVQQLELSRQGLHLDRDGNPRRMTKKTRANAPDWSQEIAQRRQRLWELNREVERCATSDQTPKVASPFPKDQSQTHCVTNQKQYKTNEGATGNCVTPDISPKVDNHLPKDQAQTRCVTNRIPYKVGASQMDCVTTAGTPKVRTQLPKVQVQTPCVTNQEVPKVEVPTIESIAKQFGLTIEEVQLKCEEIYRELIRPGQEVAFP